MFKPAKCINMRLINIAVDVTSAVDIGHDWLYALLPVPSIWRLNIKTSMKISVSGVLGLGVL